MIVLVQGLACGNQRRSFRNDNSVLCDWLQIREAKEAEIGILA